MEVVCLVKVHSERELGENQEELAHYVVHLHMLSSLPASPLSHK